MKNNNKIQFDFAMFSIQLKSKRTIYMKIGLREAAKQIGISAPTLSRLENENIPDLNTYYYCCKWLNVPMEMFFK